MKYEPSRIKIVFVMSLRVLMDTQSWSVPKYIAQVDKVGAESDSDDRFNNISGAGDCWQDGYNNGQNGPFS